MPDPVSGFVRPPLWAGGGIDVVPTDNTLGSGRKLFLLRRHALSLRSSAMLLFECDWGFRDV